MGVQNYTISTILSKKCQMVGKGDTPSHPHPHKALCASYITLDPPPLFLNPGSAPGPGVRFASAGSVAKTKTRSPATSSLFQSSTSDKDSTLKLSNNLSKTYCGKSPVEVMPSAIADIVDFANSSLKTTKIYVKLY